MAREARCPVAFAALTSDRSSRRANPPPHGAGAGARRPNPVRPGSPRSPLRGGRGVLAPGARARRRPASHPSPAQPGPTGSGLPVAPPESPSATLARRRRELRCAAPRGADGERKRRNPPGRSQARALCEIEAQKRPTWENRRGTETKPRGRAQTWMRLQVSPGSGCVFGKRAFGSGKQGACL